MSENTVAGLEPRWLAKSRERIKASDHLIAVGSDLHLLEMAVTEYDKLLALASPPASGEVEGLVAELEARKEGDRHVGVAYIVALARGRADLIEPEAWRSEALATKMRTLREFADAIERGERLPSGGR